MAEATGSLGARTWPGTSFPYDAVARTIGMPLPEPQLQEADRDVDPIVDEDVRDLAPASAPQSVTVVQPPAPVVVQAQPASPIGSPVASGASPAPQPQAPQPAPVPAPEAPPEPQYLAQPPVIKPVNVGKGSALRDIGTNIQTIGGAQAENVRQQGDIAAREAAEMAPEIAAAEEQKRAANQRKIEQQIQWEADYEKRFSELDAQIKGLASTTADPGVYLGKHRWDSLLIMSYGLIASGMGGAAAGKVLDAQLQNLANQRQNEVDEYRVKVESGDRMKATKLQAMQGQLAQFGTMGKQLADSKDVEIAAYEQMLAGKLRSIGAKYQDPKLRAQYEDAALAVEMAGQEKLAPVAKMDADRRAEGARLAETKRANRAQEAFNWAQLAAAREKADAEAGREQDKVIREAGVKVVNPDGSVQTFVARDATEAREMQKEIDDVDEFIRLIDTFLMDPADPGVDKTVWKKFGFVDEKGAIDQSRLNEIIAAGAKRYGFRQMTKDELSLVGNMVGGTGDATDFRQKVVPKLVNARNSAQQMVEQKYSKYVAVDGNKISYDRGKPPMAYTATADDYHRQLVSKHVPGVAVNAADREATWRSYIDSAGDGGWKTNRSGILASQRQRLKAIEADIEKYTATGDRQKLDASWVSYGAERRLLEMMEEYGGAKKREQDDASAARMWQQYGGRQQ